MSKKLMILIILCIGGWAMPAMSQQSNEEITPVSANVEVAVPQEQPTAVAVPAPEVPAAPEVSATPPVASEVPVAVVAPVTPEAQTTPVVTEVPAVKVAVPVPAPAPKIEEPNLKFNNKGEAVFEAAITDNICAERNMDKLDKLAASSHTINCMLTNASSGYSFIIGNHLLKVAKQSWSKVEGYLKIPGSTPHVQITAKKTADGWDLISIKNQ